MSDFIKLMCPSCGSKLSPTDAENKFHCANCGNSYLFEQKGNTVSLEQILQKATKGGTVVYGETAAVVHAENVYLGHSKTDDNKSTPEPMTSQKVECPVCGKVVPYDTTFRCRQCQRANICTWHQDPKSFLCSECVGQRKKEPLNMEEVQRSRAKASIILSAIAFFILLFLFGLHNLLPIITAIVFWIPGLILGLVSYNNNRPISKWALIVSFGLIGFALLMFFLLAIHVIHL